MEKKKKKSVNDGDPDSKSDSATIGVGKLAEEQEKMDTEQEKLRKRVANLIKKQKMKQVIRIVREHDDSKPWGQEGQVKVCHVCIFEYGNFLLFMLHHYFVHSRLAAA